MKLNPKAITATATATAVVGVSLSFTALMGGVASAETATTANATAACDGTVTINASANFGSDFAGATKVIAAVQNTNVIAHEVLPATGKFDLSGTVSLPVGTASVKVIVRGINVNQNPKDFDETIPIVQPKNCNPPTVVKTLTWIEVNTPYSEHATTTYPQYLETSAVVQALPQCKSYGTQVDTITLVTQADYDLYDRLVAAGVLNKGDDFGFSVKVTSTHGRYDTPCPPETTPPVTATPSATSSGPAVSVSASPTAVPTTEATSPGAVTSSSSATPTKATSTTPATATSETTSSAAVVGNTQTPGSNVVAYKAPSVSADTAETGIQSWIFLLLGLGVIGIVASQRRLRDFVRTIGRHLS